MGRLRTSFRLEWVSVVYAMSESTPTLLVHCTYVLTNTTPQQGGCWICACPVGGYTGIVTLCILGSGDINSQKELFLSSNNLHAIFKPCDVRPREALENTTLYCNRESNLNRVIAPNVEYFTDERNFRSRKRLSWSSLSDHWRLDWMIEKTKVSISILPPTVDMLMYQCMSVWSKLIAMWWRWGAWWKYQVRRYECANNLQTCPIPILILKW